MSEETPTTEEKTQADNFAALREQNEALQAELRPLRVERVVREAGLALDSPAGRAVSKILEREDEVDVEKVKNLAAELGFEDDPAPKPEPTPNERAAGEFANRQSQLNSVTTSDEPQNIDQQISDLDASLRSARAARNWDDVRAIGEQLQQLNIAKMRASVATHV